MTGVSARPGTAEAVAAVARVQGLVPAPDLHAVLDTLRPQLEHYAELEYRSDGSRLDLVTLSPAPSPAPVTELLGLLAARGHAGASVRPARGLLRLGAGRTVGLKIPVAAPPGGASALPGGEVYIRGALPVVEALAYLRARGVGPDAARLLETVTEACGKSTLHLLAVDIPRADEDAIRFTAFVTAYLLEGGQRDDEALVARVVEAAAALGHGGSITVDDVLDVHRVLSAERPETMYVSVPLPGDGTASPRIKLDYTGVRLGTVAEALAVVSGEEQADDLVAWGQALGTTHLDHAGVLVGPGGWEGMRAYARVA